MNPDSSRRRFLAASLALPSAGMAAPSRRFLPLPQLSQSSPSPSLTYRALGKTGLKVTSVGFGCMITSDASVIERAAAIGINYFDTARSYQGGNNERMVGSALKGKRKDIVLSSKTGATTRNEALAHLDTSLEELGTDYLDIWYLHGKSSPAQLNGELMEALEIAKKAGKIRFAGVSTHGGQAELLPAIVKSGRIDVVLTSYNFTMSVDMEPLIQSVRAAGIGIVAMKVMAGGFRRLRPEDKTRQIMQRDGAMLAALKWVLRNKNVDTTIPGITDSDQLEENLQAMAAAYSPADEKLLEAQLEYVSPLYCRMCGCCSGTCALGLPVSDIIRYLSYAEGYGQYALGREQFLTLPQDQIRIRCDECSECTVRCPNGVRVAERVGRAQEIFA